MICPVIFQEHKVKLTLLLVLFEDGSYVSFSAAIRELPQTPLPFEDDRRWLLNDISQVYMNP